jgi:uncharacterized protein YkwD
VDRVRAALLAAALVSAPAFGQRADVLGAERLIVSGANAFRREEQLSPVKASAELAKAARDFADYMARTDRYGHEADGATPAERAKRHGYDYCLVSENIAYQYKSGGFRTADLAESFVEGWRNSPPHRKNMLEPAATETGAAVARSDRSGRYYAVQMFGRPKSERIEFRIDNSASQPVRYRLGDKDYSLRPRQARTHWVCGPEDLTLQSAGAHGKVRPAQGEKLVVVNEAGGVAIRRQR